MSDNDESRQLGVELGDLEDELDELDYPVDNDELLESHGNAELELPDGTTTLEEVLGSMEDQTYQDAEEVEAMIMNMVGDEAIGRKGYSDRTPYAPGEERQEEGAPGQDVEGDQESF